MVREPAVVVASLALILGALPEVWTETQGLPEEGERCSAEALASALRAERPGLVVHAWHAESESARPPEGAMRVRLTQHEGTAVLEVNGPGRSIVRTLPATEGCERNVATAALIVDGALDELLLSTEAPRVDSLASPVPLRKQIHVSGSVGAGAEQGLFGFVPAFGVEGAARYRFVELTLDVDLGLPSSTPFSITPPESGKGTLQATTLGVDLGLGWAPRLGPGRLLVTAAFGVAFAFVSVSSPFVFQGQSDTSKEPFGALRLGYALDLPWGLFLAARAEERVAPRASFQVVGASFTQEGGDSTVMTRTWTLETLGFVGYHFF